MVDYGLLDKSLQLAAKLHAGQRRDGEHPLPYVIHPIEVVINLRYVGQVTDEDILVAAALHDVLEETDYGADQILAKFGQRAHDLVIEMTREEPSKSQTIDLSKEEIWQLRSDMLLIEIGKMTRDCQIIKLGDRLSNIREAKRTKLGEKLDRYRVQTFEILEVIPENVNPPLWNAIRSELESA